MEDQRLDAAGLPASVQPFLRIKLVEQSRWGSCQAGDPGKTRTSDLRFRKPSLYPAELRDRGTHVSGLPVGVHIKAAAGPEALASPNEEDLPHPKPDVRAYRCRRRHISPRAGAPCRPPQRRQNSRKDGRSHCALANQLLALALRSRYSKQGHLAHQTVSNEPRRLPVIGFLHHRVSLRGRKTLPNRALPSFLVWPTRAPKRPHW